MPVVNTDHGTVGRLGWMQILLRFAAARGASPIDAARLFYHVGLKPALVFRGWQRFEPQKILSFAARGPGGRKLTVHARDNSLDVGTFEEFFSSRYTIIPHGLPLLEPKVIYDIGANIGVASLYFACRYPGARLFGFEPVPDNFEVCQRNYANLINSGVFPWAVGARTERCVFELDQQDLRGGSLQASPGAAAAGSKKQIQVQVYSIADLVNEKKLPPPDFVKIDVEGAEVGVLKGIGPALPSIKRLLIETHGELLMIDCLKWALDHGFIIRHVHEAAPGFSAIWCDKK